MSVQQFAEMVLLIILKKFSALIPFFLSLVGVMFKEEGSRTLSLSSIPLLKLYRFGDSFKK